MNVHGCEIASVHGIDPYGTLHLIPDNNPEMIRSNQLDLF